MTRFSRHVFAAALCAALCPAVVRAQFDQSNSYYVVEGAAEQGMVAKAAAWMNGGGAGPACEASCAAPSCSGAAGCGDCCRGWGRGICWPCGCKLEDLGEACKLWEPCCEESQWSAGGWLAQGFTW